MPLPGDQTQEQQLGNDHGASPLANVAPARKGFKNHQRRARKDGRPGPRQNPFRSDVKDMPSGDNAGCADVRGAQRDIRCSAVAPSV